MRLPVIPDECSSNYHLFHVLLADPGRRPALLAHLSSRGVGATFHYIPLHSSPRGRALGGDRFDLPHTDFVSRAIVRLPLFPDLSTSEQNRVIDAVRDFFASH